LNRRKPIGRNAVSGALSSIVLFLLAGSFVAGCQSKSSAPKSEVRLGYFANVTHMQALVGLAKGEFRRHLGADVTLTPKLFSAGPAAIEALLAGEIDLAYTGPSPTINGFIRSEGKALRVIAGATQGGAVFVRRSDVVLKTQGDFAGKRFASPQIGNTQDISLRTYLGQMGLATKERGGSVEVLPLANADILALFLRKELDGAWVPEPWGSILVHRANGVVLVDERDLWPNGKFATTLLVASRSFLESRPEWVQRVVEAHLELSQWIQEHRGEAREIVNQEIARYTRRRIDEAILTEALSRLEVTVDPLESSLETFFERAKALGYLRGGSLKGMLDLRYLEQARSSRQPATGSSGP